MVSTVKDVPISKDKTISGEDIYKRSFNEVFLDLNEEEYNIALLDNELEKSPSTVTTTKIKKGIKRLLSLSNELDTAKRVKLSADLENILSYIDK